MKILVDTESYWPNRDGGSVVERNLVLGLGALGHDVRVVAPSPSGKPYLEKDGTSQIHRVRSFRTPGKFGRVGARGAIFPKGTIRKLIKEWQPDMIHGHNLFSVGLATFSIARETNIPYVATNHNMPENLMDNIGPLRYLIPGGAERVWKWQIGYLNRADFVTSPTKTAVDLLLDHGLTVPNRPVSNGVDLERYRPDVGGEAELAARLGLPKDKPVVLYMGRLDGEKRMDIWINAIPEIRKQIDAHFLIGGRGGETPALKEQAARLGVAEHVTFAGLIEDDDLPTFYRLGTVFAISSPAELQSLVTLEAMGAGRPVVACDAGALPELCKSGRNGYLFLAGDPAGMAKSVVQVLKNPSMSEKMGAESRRIVEESHDVKEMPKNYEGIYKEVLAAKAAAGKAVKD